MKPRWLRRLDAARNAVLADGPEFLYFLRSPNADVRQAALDVLAGVCWKEEHFLNSYFYLLMQENRRG